MVVYLAPFFFVGKRLFPDEPKSVVQTTLLPARAKIVIDNGAPNN